MELKLKLKYVLAITLMFWILICVNWYSNMDYVVVANDKQVDRLSDNELLQASQNGYKVNFEKTYNWESSTTTKVTKGKFPFSYNKEIMKKTEPKLLENRY